MTHTFNKKVLSNGLTCITIPQKERVTATVLVLVSCGSKYETKDIGGISHFLEHMCFKGTKRRPRAIDISSELDALGAQYNAFTGHEYTGYYAKVSPKHLSRAVDVVSDIYINQIFRPDEVKRESGVIIEEINMYEDDPKRKIQENIMRLLYGDQPAGWDIAGTKKTVSGITPKDLLSYHTKHYVAKKTVVIVAGKFSEQKILSDIKRCFSGIRNAKPASKKKVVEKQGKPKIATEYRNTDQTHMIVALRAFPYKDKRVPALRLLSTVLGGGMSSRLFQRVREELGAAYYIYSFADLYTDHGFLGIACGSDNKKAKQVLSVILSELKRLSSEEISPKELAKAKDYLVGTTALSLETTDNVANFYGNQHIMDKELKSPDDAIAQIQRVTAKDIHAVAKDICKNKLLNLAVIGPVRDKKPFVPILSL